MTTATATTAPEAVTNCLGESRCVEQSWPDGSYTCPYCGAGVVPSDRDRPCPNPACEANPYMKPPEILRRREQHAERERDAARHKAQTQRMIASSREWHQRQAAEVAQARKAGYCPTCFIRSGNRKRVRHRTPNYHEQRDR
jgi:hypothetical protein